MTGAALSSFRLDIVSDTICPWCYVGKRRLAAALPILEAEGLTFDVTWRPFQLNPTMPREGLDRRAAHTAQLNSAPGKRARHSTLRLLRQALAPVWCSVTT
jgi:predicted DsbA family dithiol-disulfide isomerase